MASGELGPERNSVGGRADQVTQPTNRSVDGRAGWNAQEAVKDRRPGLLFDQLAEGLEERDAARRMSRYSYSRPTTQRREEPHGRRNTNSCRNEHQRAQD